MHLLVFLMPLPSLFSVERHLKFACNHNYTGNLGKSLLVKKYLGAVAFNNITRLAFGKRFENSEGIINEQGQEFKAIVANGLKLGASLAMAEHIPWLRWMFPLDEEAFAKHGARRDRLTRAIMEEHTLARQKSGATKQHFFDALLTLQEKYDLSEDTIIGLLWVSQLLISSNYNFNMMVSIDYICGQLGKVIVLFIMKTAI